MPRRPGEGVLILPDFDLEGAGTFVPWFRPTYAELIFAEFTLVGTGTFFLIPGPEPCVPCLDRSLLVSLYGWGVTDISTSFDYYPCSEEIVSPNIRPLKKKKK